jgi:hypothetical protein
MTVFVMLTQGTPTCPPLSHQCNRFLGLRENDSFAAPLARHEI